MMYKSKKSNLIIAIILFLVAAIFLVYGIYIVNYSIDYIHTYMEISTISPDNAFQYVVTSSAVYFGFAIVIFIGGMIIFSTRKVYYDPNDPKAGKRSVRSGKNKNQEDRDNDADAHPENNPYYTAPTAPESITESPQTPATPKAEATFAQEVESIINSHAPEFDETGMSEPESAMDVHGIDEGSVSGGQAESGAAGIDTYEVSAAITDNAVADNNAISDNNATVVDSDISKDDIERFLLDELEPVRSEPVVKQAAPSIKYHEPVIEPAPQQQAIQQQKPLPLKQEAAIKDKDLKLRRQAALAHKEPALSKPERHKEHNVTGPERKEPIIPETERKTPIISEVERKADTLKPENNTAHPQPKKEEHISGLDIKNIFENL